MTPYLQDPDLTLYNGDVEEVLVGLPDESVQMCVTSPPYWGLRDYGTGVWEGGDSDCDHVGVHERSVSGGPGKQYTNVGSNRVFSGDCKCGASRTDNQLGLEATPDEYVAKMVDVFREVRRVLRRDGTLWLNLGDSYNAYNGGAGPSSKLSKTQSEQRPRLVTGFGLQCKTLKPKDLCMIPARVALALQADGWYLRSEITWCKPNPMPESVTDRPTQATEKLYLFSRSPRYFWDAEAVREPHSDKTWFYKAVMPTKAAREQNAGNTNGLNNSTLGTEAAQNPAGRNLRNWWEIATEPMAEKVRSVRRVREEPGAGVDGKKRIASPDCPVHGDRPAPAATLPDGEREGAESSRIERIAARLDREPLTVFAPTEQNPEQVIELGSSGSPDLPCSDVATPHSSESRRTGLAPATTEPCTPSAETSGHTGDRSASPASSEPHPDSPENRTSPAGSDAHPSAESLGHTGCTCEWEYAEYTSHFAAFPQELVRRCILAGTSERGCCPECGAAWVREIENTPMVVRPSAGREAAHAAGSASGRRDTRGTMIQAPSAVTTGWRPSCDHGGVDLTPVLSPTGERAGEDPSFVTGRAGMNRPRGDAEGRRPISRYEQQQYAAALKASPARPQMEAEAGDAFAHYIRTDRSGARPIPADLLERWIGEGWLDRVEIPEVSPPDPVACVVLDPFFGSGTTGLVARKHGRRTIGIELSSEYAALASKRLSQLSLLAEASSG